jgi:hypothetical protein
MANRTEAPLAVAAAIAAVAADIEAAAVVAVCAPPVAGHPVAGHPVAVAAKVAANRARPAVAAAVRDKAGGD